MKSVSGVRSHHNSWLTFVLILLIPACQAGNDLSRIEEISPSPTANAITVPSFSEPTGESSPTPALTTLPPTNNQLPFLVPLEILTSEFKNEDFQDLIIFASSMPGVSAYANFPLDIRWAEGTESHLYAFSPDGKRAGTLIPPNFASTIYLPSNSSGKPLLVEYGVVFDHPEVNGIELPPECYHPLTEGGEFLPCGRFQFSRDGEYVGFFFGPSECRRAIIIQDTETGIQAYHSMHATGHYFVLPGKGNAIIASGHCEGGSVELYNLNSRGFMVRQLGSEGQQTWNADSSAFAVQVDSYGGIDSSIWGFNLETDQLFLEVPGTPQIDDHPVWTPDKRYLLYQHRTFTRAGDGFTPTGFDQARQIILVDTQTGNQKMLLSDSAYDFHLGSCDYCDEWHGDWIQIRRVLFTPVPIKGREEMYSSRQFTCRMQAQNCETPVDLYALNWKTGELKPWSEMVEAGLNPDPDLIDTPAGPNSNQQPIFEQPGQYTLYEGPQENTFWVDWRYGGEGGAKILSGPNLNLPPVYTHPSGRYAYYAGIDGKSLWMVPEEGLPLPWVLDGYNYFYLGEK